MFLDTGILNRVHQMCILYSVSKTSFKLHTLTLPAKAWYHAKEVFVPLLPVSLARCNWPLFFMFFWDMCLRRTLKSPPYNSHFFPFEKNWVAPCGFFVLTGLSSSMQGPSCCITMIIKDFVTRAVCFGAERFTALEELYSWVPYLDSCLCLPEY